MKNYFKVKYGYGSTEFVSIEEKELPKVLKAWQNDSILSMGDTVIKGGEIKSISPHYNKYTGWNENYEPKDAEDFLQIKRDCPLGLEACVENAKMFLLDGGKPENYENLLLNSKIKLIQEYGYGN